jgi:hypothetical protein
MAGKPEDTAPSPGVVPGLARLVDELRYVGKETVEDLRP